MTDNNIALMAAASASAQTAAAQRAGRRRANEGKDQLLLFTRLSPERAAKRIAGIYEDTYAQDAQVKVHKPLFSWGGAIGAFIIGGIVWLIVMYAFMEFTHNDYSDWSFPWVVWCIITILTASTIGWVAGGDEELGHVSIEAEKNGSSVLLHVYDDDGVRNLDEREIHDIMEAIEVRRV